MFIGIFSVRLASASQGKRGAPDVATHNEQVNALLVKEHLMLQCVEYEHRRCFCANAWLRLDHSPVISAVEPCDKARRNFPRLCLLPTRTVITDLIGWTPRRSGFKIA